MKTIKHIIKIAYIKFFYKRYVRDISSIQLDIEANISFRSPQHLRMSQEKKFKHLMVYYTDFAYLFFWRIDKFNIVNRILFCNNSFSYFKIFKNIDLKGGVIPCHAFATIINAKQIGENFTFRNTTTIGNKGNDNSLTPTLGSNVELGANVVIIGDIKIGDNVTIGAGAVVTKDIASNSIAIGNPARVIKKK